MWSIYCGRTFYNHVGNGLFHPGIEMAALSHEPGFQSCQPAEEQSSIHGRGISFLIIIIADYLLTAKTTGKTHGLPIGSGQGGRDTVHPADQHPVLIQAA